MYSISDFIILHEDEEESSKKKKKASKTNAQGVMHELLTGYHLNGGKHMVNHKGEIDSKRVTPKQAHDTLRKQHFSSPEEYHEAHEAAKHAAAAIKAHILAHHPGGRIAHVHWTSKPGDTEKVTGHKATQKQDPSDLYVTVHHKDEEGDEHVTHHGISLKNSKKATAHIPIGNPGLEVTHGGKAIADKHKEDLRKKYPHLDKMSVDARKAHMKAHPEEHAEINKLHTHAIHKIVHHTHEVLKKLHPEHMANYLAAHVLQSRRTPAEKHGHYHWRVSTDKTKSGHRTRIINPHEHYGHLLGLAKAGKIRTQPKEGSLNFVHHEPGHPGNGKTHASLSFKLKSRSDPLGNIGGRTNSSYSGPSYRGTKGH